MKLDQVLVTQVHNFVFLLLQVDLWEINEAFSAVVLANMKLSELVSLFCPSGSLVDFRR